MRGKSKWREERLLSPARCRRHEISPFQGYLPLVKYASEREKFTKEKNKLVCRLAGTSDAVHRGLRYKKKPRLMMTIEFADARGILAHTLLLLLPFCLRVMTFQRVTERKKSIARLLAAWVLGERLARAIFKRLFWPRS